MAGTSRPYQRTRWHGQTRWQKYHAQRKATGKRSGLEVKVATQLDRVGVLYTYEPDYIDYIRPEEKAKYLPDFVLGNGIIVEVKGEFTSADRKKHLLLKEQHPELDIRFVFSNPQAKIGKKSKTTYALWCEVNGFLYAKQMVPQEWIARKCTHDWQSQHVGITTVSWKCQSCGEIEEKERDHQ